VTSSGYQVDARTARSREISARARSYFVVFRDFVRLSGGCPDGEVSGEQRPSTLLLHAKL